MRLVQRPVRRQTSPRLHASTAPPGPPASTSTRQQSTAARQCPRQQQRQHRLAVPRVSRLCRVYCVLCVRRIHRLFRRSGTGRLLRFVQAPCSPRLSTARLPLPRISTAELIQPVFPFGPFGSPPQLTSAPQRRTKQHQPVPSRPPARPPENPDAVPCRWALALALVPASLKIAPTIRHHPSCDFAQTTFSETLVR